MSAEEPEQLTPAERRLGRHLALLHDLPDSPASLTQRVMRTARWQRAVRSPLLAVAHIASAAAETVRVLIGGRR
jgi:hypothetical protein